MVMWIVVLSGDVREDDSFQIVGSWRIFMSLTSLQYAALKPSSQPCWCYYWYYKAISTLPKMTVVSAHPPFPVSVAKTWDFDKLRVGWGCVVDPCPIQPWMMGFFFGLAVVAKNPATLPLRLPMFFSRAFLIKRDWCSDNLLGWRW